jgi:uncharacterized protein (DUF2141 family)
MSEAKEDWKEREIGALWRKGDQDPFYSGTIDLDALKQKSGKVQIVVFKNKHKQAGETTPDLRVYISKPLEK